MAEPVRQPVVPADDRSNPPRIPPLSERDERRRQEGLLPIGAPPRSDDAAASAPDDRPAPITLAEAGLFEALTIDVSFRESQLRMAAAIQGVDMSVTVREQAAWAFLHARRSEPELTWDAFRAAVEADFEVVVEAAEAFVLALFGDRTTDEG